jgi:type II secretory pathway component GspD/PulD (secretin)
MGIPIRPEENPMLMRSMSVLVVAACLTLSACQTAPEQVPEQRVFEVVPLESAEAEMLAHSLRGLFNGSSVMVQADARTNSLLLAGWRDEMASAKAVVAQLDVNVVAAGPQASVEVIVLEHALADDVRDSLRGLIDKRTSQIAVDDRMNALLVSAAPEPMTRIKALVDQLDRPQQGDAR